MSAKGLNIGDYVRTKCGKIIKVDGKKYYTNNEKTILFRAVANNNNETYKIIKSSPSIIDLIEEGDLVKIENEGWVQVSIKFEALKFFDNSGTEYLYEEIEAIITKEQLEQMEYKIGE